MDNRWFMDDADASDQNPYTVMEGYALEDVSGARIGEIKETVYDAVSDVLKYVIANGLLPALLLQVGGFGLYLVFFALGLIIQFVALFWFLSRGRKYVIYPGEYDVGFTDVRG